MKCQDINLRDPFVLCENGKYYMYGSRAKNFAVRSGGFDVYVSEDLENWSEPVECFRSEQYGLNEGANWAPEVHCYRGGYYMFATFKQEDGLRGTYILKADSPMGPFVPHSNGAVTPDGWECLDGTLYLNRQGRPYIVFCHECTQIIDGTICYAPLNEDLTALDGEMVTLFCATSPEWVTEVIPGKRYITDGPYMYRSCTDELFMLWSTFIGGKYAQCLVKFNGGELGMDYVQMPPLITDDGGHGMIFRAEDRLCLTFHRPNSRENERPVFVTLRDEGDALNIEA